MAGTAEKATEKAEEATEKTVLYERDGKIAYITLNRPDRLNAISAQMLQDLGSAIDALEEDAEARVAILRGAGRSFCAGFDLSNRTGTVKGADRTPWEDRQRLRGYAQMFLRLWDCPKPIIAQVHGHCLAGGVQLPMCCDMIVVADDCTVGWAKIPSGGGWIGPMFSWYAGPHRAKQMSYRAGSQISGQQAADWGYANVAVPADELAATVLSFATEMARVPASLLQLKKAAINRVWDKAGFRETVLAGAEWDVLAHKDPGTIELRAWLREVGLKGTIDRYREQGL
jgi:enoyl-CoA hydratase